MNSNQKVEADAMVSTISFRGLTQLTVEKRIRDVL